MSKNNEIWKPILVNNKKTDLPFVVSNKGAYGIKKTNGEIEVRVKKIKSGSVRHRLRVGGKEQTLSLAKMIATAFVKKSSAKQTAVIHLDHDYTNNHPSNLKWVTTKDHRAHIDKSPSTILARTKKAFTKSVHSRVLNEKSATELKKMIWDPKRKLSYKQLAEKFGVSEMQIYRIKSAELWFHIKVENEPTNARYEQNLKNIAYQVKLKETGKTKEIKDTKGAKEIKATKSVVSKKLAGSKSATLSKVEVKVTKKKKKDKSKKKDKKSKKKNRK